MNEVMFIGATMGLKAGALIGLGLLLARALAPGQRLGFLRALLLAVLALPLLTWLLPPWMVPLLPGVEPGSETSMILEAGSPATVSRGGNWLQWPLAVYLAGVAFLVARLLYQYGVLKRWARQAQPLIARDGLLPPWVSERRRLRVGWCGRIDVPLSFGWLRSEVLIPESWRREQGERVSHALAHELAHIERRDWLWLVLIRVAHSLTWWNPLIYPLLRLLDEETELACDRRALTRVRSPAGYARSLLSLAGNPILAAVPMSGVRYWRLRLRNALGYQTEDLKMNRVCNILAALLLLAAVVPLAACQIVRAAEPTPDPTPVRAPRGEDYFGPVADPAPVTAPAAPTTPTPAVAPTPTTAPTHETAPRLATDERAAMREESEARRAEFQARRGEMHARRAALDSERLRMRGEQERLGAGAERSAAELARLGRQRAALSREQAEMSRETEAMQAELEAVRRELEATREELERARMELEQVREG